MATVLVDKVQYDDRLATGGRVVDYGGALQDLAQVGVQIDANKQTSDLEQAQRDNFAAFQELERGRQSGQDVLTYSPADKSTWSPGQQRAFDDLRSKLDRNRSLLEQGMMTTEAFEARANALTRDAISRRPSLARELSSVSANVLGFDPRSDIEIEVSRLRANAAKVKEEYFDSPEYKVEKEAREIAVRLRAARGDSMTEEEAMQSAKTIITFKAETDAKKAELDNAKIRNEAIGVVAAKSLEFFQTGLNSESITIFANLPDNPNDIAAGIMSGAVSTAIDNIVAGQTAKADQLYVDMVTRARSLVSPDEQADALSAANTFRAQAYAAIDTKFKEMREAGKDKANSAGAALTLVKQIRDYRQDSLLAAKYGANYQVGRAVEIAAATATTQAAVKAVSETGTGKVELARTGAGIVKAYSVPTAVTGNNDVDLRIDKPGYNSTTVFNSLSSVNAATKAGMEPLANDVKNVATNMDVLVVGGLKSNSITPQDITKYNQLAYSNIIGSGLRYPMKEGDDARRGKPVEALANTVAFLAQGGAGKGSSPEQNKALTGIAASGVKVSQGELNSIKDAKFSDGSTFKSRAVVLPVKTTDGVGFKVQVKTEGLSPDDIRLSRVWAKYSTESIAFQQNSFTAGTTLQGQAPTLVAPKIAEQLRKLGYTVASSQ